MTEARTVGVVGLGIMGGSMARNLAAAGWRVLGYDHDPARMQAMQEVVETRKLPALVQDAPTLLLSLPSSAALRVVAHGIVAAHPLGRTVVETSTLPLDDKLEARAVLEAAGAIMLDCPLSGTGEQAKTRDLIVYASGDTEAIGRLQPLFDGFARETQMVGPFGDGMRMKLVANLLVAIHNVASAEAMVLAKKAGLDLDRVVQMVRSGAGASRVFELRAPLMAQRRWSEPTMKIDVFQKDLDIIGAFAADLDCPTSLLDATLPVYAAAKAQGHGGHDTAAVYAVLENAAKISPKPDAVAPQRSWTEDRDGMRIDWNVPIPMDDGLELRADVFRPIAKGQYPVLLTYGPYAKGLSFQQGYPSAWERMAEKHPDVTAGSSNLYQNWEVVDPEKWIPHGYVVVRVDSRGCGTSPGYIDHFSPRETRDFHESIEWAALQPWSSGKIGLNGVSYFGINQWQVASTQPPHLAAMCIWEGAADFYRDMSHHGGILSTFWANWSDMQVKTVQHGVGEVGRRSPATGELVCGPELLPPQTLERNRCNFGDDIFAHPLDDDYHKVRSPDWSRVTVPFLSAANWGGQGLHPRGNFEGFVRAASKHKYLEAHGLEHWTEFYTDYGREMQLRFFNRFLKGEEAAWPDPPVRIQVRHLNHFEERQAQAWPLPDTRWIKFALELDALTLTPMTEAADGAVSFDSSGEGVTFLTAPLDEETEITGPSMVALNVSSSTADADLFVVLRVFSPELKEVAFQGAIDPHTPVGQGWLRASHRKLDLALSTPYRPYHSHDEIQPLTPGKAVSVEVEIWPTSLVAPKGYRIGLSVRGKDYQSAESGGRLSNFKNELRGCGPFLHNDLRDRPADVFGGMTTLHSAEGERPYLLLPIIPRS